jgi:cell division protease FtsH
MERRAALDKVAEALLEFETIDGKHVLEILQFGEIRSPIVPPVPPKADAGGKPSSRKNPEKNSAPESIGPAPAPNPA